MDRIIKSVKKKNLIIVENDWVNCSVSSDNSQNSRSIEIKIKVRGLDMNLQFCQQQKIGEIFYPNPQRLPRQLTKC